MSYLKKSISVILLARRVGYNIHIQFPYITYSTRKHANI